MKIQATVDDDLDKNITEAAKTLDCSKAEIVRTALRITFTTELSNLEGNNGND